MITSFLTALKRLVKASYSDKNDADNIKTIEGMIERLKKKNIPPEKIKKMERQLKALKGSDSHKKRVLKDIINKLRK